jgi:hypothetical protein
VVIYSKLVSRSDVRPNSGNLSPRPREFGLGGDLIGRFPDAHNAATRLAAKRFVAADFPHHADLITTNAKTPVI